jgi:hypothetical protein
MTQVVVPSGGLRARPLPVAANVRTVASASTVSDLLANAGLVSVSVQSSLAAPVPAPSGAGLPQSVGLTGLPNNPKTPPYANSPGLNSGESENSMSKHWMWIVIVVLVLLALWYFSGSSASVA